ncbi:DUF1223 domain-containing protein [Novosphingobium sp.]|uniref:DUF1223 domain-containing protein n=1 Tax=Novosphingobium sp. TaxID=1874826 RepID=UPI003BA9E92B
MPRSPSLVRRLAAIALLLGLAGSAVLAGHALISTAMASAPAAPRVAAAPAAPVLVELYQSEGCSSCPPAEAWLNGIADRPNVIPLAFEVTYWDYLGWKDRFASPAYTQRQRDFAARSPSHEVATPQFWINGQQSVSGANPRAVEAAIASVRTTAPVPSVGAGSVTIAKGAAPARPADVWLVRYDPRTIEVPIKAGENGGRTLPHRNLVRELTRLGAWSGGAVRFAYPPATGGLRSAVFLQDGRGGAVLSAGSDAQ